MINIIKGAAATLQILLRLFYKVTSNIWKSVKGISFIKALLFLRSKFTIITLGVSGRIYNLVYETIHILCM